MHRYPDVAVLDLGRTCTIDDVCDFVVKYIESDILGLLADRHLTIAGVNFFPNILWTVSNCFAVDQSAVGVLMLVYRIRGSDVFETVRYSGPSLRDVSSTLLEVS